ncbi:MAG: amino-acid N-acetyltransferase [Spirochaetales bacterium]|nr:amino-acid N-acetyltransferase [Spirochaetales bacterium]
MSEIETQKRKGQVELIRQVFEYIQRFKGKTFVIKIEGSLMSDPLFPLLVKDLVLLHRLGIQIVLVPGAKQRIDEILSRYQIPWRTVEGVRISTPEAVPFIKMAAFDVSNRLMTQLAENSTHAVIGNWVRARSVGVRGGIDYQMSGMVEKVNVELVRKTLAEGLVPIFPNIGWSVTGKPYNLSSNELASRLAGELRADKLFFVSNHLGVKAERYHLPEGIERSEDGRVAHLTAAQAQQLVGLNADKGGEEMLELLRLAQRACSEGVSRVHIVNGEIEGVILQEIFSSRGSGTMIYANQHENIRSMRVEDIPEVLRIMQPFVDREILLSRTESELAERGAEFVVYEVDGIIHACGALHLSAAAPERGEIAGVAVDETYSGMGIGKRIVSYLIEQARRARLRQLYVLTTQTWDWFVQFGFRDGTVSDLPEDKRELYDRRRNSRVLLLELGDTPREL